ncbi:TlpA family protein disulfide reductase [Dyadobacter crusticola]|uniref:TlpA family protein disulfide reductase n=1 Tax=Dyadobacter crusticola TaxID=292407 RepID=UPI0004E0D2A2|nr:thioredoxin family protein [Dyadobacter crusticola]
MKRLLTSFLLVAFESFSQETDSRVVVSGITNDKSIDEVVLYDAPPFLDINELIVVSKSTQNERGEFTLKFNIEHPQILKLFVKGRSWEMFVSPGSNQKFEILKDGNNKNISFSGQNAGNSAFLNDLNDHLRADKIKTPLYSFTENLSAYKARVDSFHKKEIDFLNEFASNQPVDKALLSGLLAYEYQSLLDAPKRSNPQVQLPADYMKDIRDLSVLDEKIIGYRQFSDYLRSRFILSKSKRDDIRANFSALYQDINLKTKGKSNDFLTSSLIGFYVINSSSIDTSNTFDAVLKKAMLSITDTIYGEYLTKKFTEYNYLNKAIPDDVLDRTILIRFKDKEKKTLREFMMEYKSSAAYFDFWASWCLPCRYDIEESEKSKALLSEEKIRLVYLSIDKDQKSWEKAVLEDNIVDNQFLIQDGLKSELVKYYTVYSIPRYFFLDKDHMLKDVYAPRLGKSHFESLRKVINNDKIQVTTYK